jgi:hypothetical protein
MTTIKLLDCLSEEHVTITIYEHSVSLKPNGEAMRVFVGEVRKDRVDELMRWIDAFGTTVAIPIKVATRIVDKLLEKN